MTKAPPASGRQVGPPLPSSINTRRRASNFFIREMIWCNTVRAEAAPLATEGDRLVVAAVAAAQEAVGQDAALQERVELVLDELRSLPPAR